MNVDEQVDDDRWPADDRRLARALRSGLDDGPVDVASLLVGARQGARRVRRRRVVGLAAGVLATVVVAVPVGAGLFPGDAGPRDVDGSAATGVTSLPTTSLPTTSLPTTSLPTPSPPTGPPTTIPPATSPATLPDGTVDVPLAAMLAADEVPLAGDLTDVGSRRGVLTVGGLLCEGEAEPAADLDRGGRTLLYSDLAAGASVSTSVRLFDGDGASQTATYVADALARCSAGTTASRALPTQGLPGEQPVLAVAPDFPAPGTHVVTGLVRQGGATVSVAVQQAGTPDEVAASATALLVRAHARLVASGLPESFGG